MLLCIGITISAVVHNQENISIQLILIIMFDSNDDL